MVRMKRRRKEASQRSKRSRHRDSVGSEDASESDDEVLPTNVVVADGPSDEEEKREDEDEEERLDFTQTDYAVQMSQAELPAGDDDDDEEVGGSKKNKEPTKPKALHKLSDKALDELTAKLVRYILYKGGLKLPIKFADISKDVFPQYKNVSRYFFFHAKQKVESVFGYRVVQVEDSTNKELYLVLNNASSQEHLLLMNKTGKAASRGFLMMVLGLLWCALRGDFQKIWKNESNGCWFYNAEELWKQLIRLESKVKLKVNHPHLGDIPLLFKTFENQLYLDATLELDADLKKIKYYQYGPRTFLEVSKVQILNFVCKLITGRPPSEVQVNEILAEDS